MKSVRRAEIFLFLMGAILLLGAAYLSTLGTDRLMILFGVQSRNLNLKLAEVRVVVDSVRRKKLDSPEFIQLRKNQDIFNDDSIMTGKNSKSLLTFIDGSTVEIGPDSLVQIQVHQDPVLSNNIHLNLDVQRGTQKVLVKGEQLQVTAVNESASANTIIEVPAIAKVTPIPDVPQTPTAAVESSPPPMPVTVKNELKTEPVLLARDHSSSTQQLTCWFEGSQMTGATVVLTVMCDPGLFGAAVLVKDEKSDTIYKAEIDIPPSHRGVFQFTTDRSGELLFEIDQKYPASIKMLVEKSNPAKERIEASILRSPENYTVFILSEQENILFTWESIFFNGSEDEFQFEITQDPQFHSVIFSENTKLNFLLYQPKSNGTYYWKVTDLRTKKQSAIFQFSEN